MRAVKVADVLGEAGSKKRIWCVYTIYCFILVSLCLAINLKWYKYHPSIIKETVVQNDLPQYLIKGAKEAEEVTAGTIWLDREAFLKEKPSFTRQWYAFSREGYSEITGDTCYAVRIYGEQPGTSHMIALCIAQLTPFDTDDYYQKALSYKDFDRENSRTIFWIISAGIIIFLMLIGVVIARDSVSDIKEIRRC